MDKETYSDESILRRSAQFEKYKANVDTDDGRALAERLRPGNTIPTLIFLDSNARELHRYVGFMNASELSAHLDQAYREAGLPVPE